ncbi:MAG TPA: hypothetical protein VND19_03850 [Acetobacteraceae bacterium]|nr:hypothetical protein [Acetobacteraceae bacterium]
MPEQTKPWWVDPVWWQVVVAVIAVAMGSFWAYHGSKQRQAVPENKRKTQQITGETNQTMPMRIYQPQNGDVVKERVFVSGYSAYPMRNNYLFVTDAVGGVHYLQRGRISVDPNGAWSQAAVFGEHGNCGVEFIVTEVATAEVIISPTVEQFPDDAIVTPAIRVAREPCKPP